MHDFIVGKLRLLFSAPALPVLTCLYCLCAWAQGDLDIRLTDIQADAATKSSVRVGFKTTKPGAYVLIYGIDTSYGYQSSQIQANKAGVGIISGLPPDRNIHYRICYIPGGNSPQPLCSVDQVAHTAKADVPGIELAIEPKTFEIPMPPLTGETFAVNENCSNFQDQLEAAAKADGNLNHYVTIPPGTYCYGNFEYFPKRGPNPNGDGVIVVRTGASDDDLPPEGMRISPEWEKSMPRIINNAIFINISDDLPAECVPEEFYWLTSMTKPNKYHLCTEKNTWKLLESLPIFSAGAELPASCVDGQFFLPFRADGEVRYAMFRCIADNDKRTKWIPVNPRGDGGQALSNTYTKPVKGYRFMGLIFETAEPNGINYSGLLDIGNYSSKHENVMVDRCIFRVPPNGSSFAALQLNGSRVGVVNSWFDMRVVPGLHPYNPVSNSVAINITGGSGPFRINNNYVRGSGFMIFVNDNDTVVPRDDIDVRRNTFSYDDKFRCGSPTSDKVCRDVRGPIELKRGRRVLFEGNIIDTFWSTLTGGQAFIVTPRASGSNGPDKNEYQISDVTIRYNIVRNGTGFAQITGQDDVGYRNTKLTQRVTITHNLITGIDAYKLSDKNFGPNRGQVLAIANGVEDLTFRHNTVIDNRGTGPSFLHGSYAAMSGLDFRDNILWVNSSEVGVTRGIRWSEPSLLPNSAPGNRTNELGVLNGMVLSIPNTNWTFRNNIIVAGPGVKSSDLRASYPNPSGNQFLQQSSLGVDPIGFEDFFNNFRVNSASKSKSVASDGTDPGADIDELERRTGQIRTHWPDEVSTDSATIVFYPPDAYACMVEVSDDSTYKNAIRVRDQSTGLRHIIPVTGLKSGTHYYYRLSCASATVTKEFDTAGVAP